MSTPKSFTRVIQVSDITNNNSEHQLGQHQQNNHSVSSDSSKSITQSFHSKKRKFNEISNTIQDPSTHEDSSLPETSSLNSYLSSSSRSSKRLRKDLRADTQKTVYEEIDTSIKRANPEKIGVSDEQLPQKRGRGRPKKINSDNARPKSSVRKTTKDLKQKETSRSHSVQDSISKRLYAEHQTVKNQLKPVNKPMKMLKKLQNYLSDDKNAQDYLALYLDTLASASIKDHFVLLPIIKGSMIAQLMLIDIQEKQVYQQATTKQFKCIQKLLDSKNDCTCIFKIIGKQSSLFQSGQHTQSCTAQTAYLDSIIPVIQSLQQFIAVHLGTPSVVIPIEQQLDKTLQVTEVIIEKSQTDFEDVKTEPNSEKQDKGMIQRTLSVDQSIQHSLQTEITHQMDFTSVQNVILNLQKIRDEANRGLDLLMQEQFSLMNLKRHY